MSETIGILKTPWIRGESGETNIGNWETDAMRKYLRADIAFQNRGGIRKDLEKGAITVRDVWEIAPFGNTLMRVELKGYQLRRAIRWQVEKSRELLQVSGLKIAYNSRTKDVIYIKSGDAAIDDERTYTFITNNFIVGHLQKYFGLEKSEVRIESTGVTDRDLFIRAIREQGEVESYTEGRVVDLAK